MTDSERASIYRGRVVDLGTETFTAPDGRRFELEVVRHPGGAAIAAVNAAGDVCLIRQYRHAAGGWLIELPAGKLDPGEPARHTAERELREEAGVEAARWEELGTMLPTPGFCDERIHLYLARDLTDVNTAHEEDEIIEIEWRSLDAACSAALSGEIDDAKTVVGLLRARALLDGR